MDQNEGDGPISARFPGCGNLCVEDGATLDLAGMSSVCESLCLEGGGILDLAGGAGYSGPTTMESGTLDLGDQIMEVAEIDLATLAGEARDADSAT